MKFNKINYKSFELLKLLLSFTVHFKQKNKTHKEYKKQSTLYISNEKSCNKSVSAQLYIVSRYMGLL